MKAYRLISSKAVTELNGTVNVYEHIKSGATLVHIANDDKQKLFMVGFRTMPEDDTGIAHIMEHSVLEGSMKYPVKSPFLELTRGSLNTFLNAMTGRDFTCYPVMSPNIKDYFNLMSVYLDAVFAPRMYVDPMILMQEGWHYELNDKAELVINGVVFNEMKGAMSSPQEMLGDAVSRALFTNFYARNSGGDPASIPNLTQAQFEAFHKKYYHPSNSCTVISGDMDIEPIFEYIDSNYFGAYTRPDALLSVPTQERFTASRECVEDYPVEDGAPEEGMAYLAMSCLAPDACSTEDEMGMRLLSEMLIGSDAAPVKKAILDAGIGKEVSGYIDASKDLSFFLEVDGANDGAMPKLRATLDAEFGRLASGGLDPKLVEATLNSYEFQLRESQLSGVYARIWHAINAVKSWNYGMDIADGLRFEDDLASIRNKAANGYFEALIKKVFIGNPHTVYVTLRPVKGLLTARENAERERLAAVKAAMSDDELAAIKQKAEALLAHQQEPDSPEALATIPRLTLADVERKAEPLTLEELKCAGAKLLYHEEFTSGIVYGDALFDMACLDAIDYPDAALLAALLGRLAAGGMSYEELSREINASTGGISANCFNIARPDGSVYTALRISFKCVKAMLDKTVSLVKAILASTDYADEARLSQLVQSIYTERQSSLQENGQNLAITRNQSYIRPEAAAEDALSGLGFYSALARTAASVPADANKLGERLAAIAAKLFTKSALTLTLTGGRDEYEAFDAAMPALVDALSDARYAPAAREFRDDVRNEGIMSASMVQYVSEVCDVAKLGYSYNGSLLAVGGYLRTGYIWNCVRVQGGAYGCSLYATRNGLVGYASYRDPKLTETLDVYRGIGEHLRTADISQNNVDMQIITSIGRLDTPMAPNEAGAKAVSEHFTGVTYEDRQRERDELMATTVADFRAAAPMFDAVAEKRCICVFGNGDKLRANADIFGALIRPED